MAKQSVVTSGDPPLQRVIAVAGILFATLFVASFALIHAAVPADPRDPGVWMTDPGLRRWVSLGLNLVPFAGIAFLWYMAVLRNHIGLLEDRLLATVFLGSGLLFVATLFVCAGVSRGMLDDFGHLPNPGEDSAYRLARGITYSLMNGFGMRMAAVFMFVTSSIGMKTGVFPRALSVVGFVFGAVLLASIADFVWISLLFPLWALILSVYLLCSPLVPTPPTPTAPTPSL
ncbi:MAG: hypothetical protein U0795_06690 [Pirellulales bacterium]